MAEPETLAIEAPSTVADVAAEKVENALEAVSLEVDVTPPAIEPIGVNEGLVDPEAEATFEHTVNGGLGNPEADAAFERFMSEEIADEPSREWILAG